MSRPRNQFAIGQGYIDLSSVTFIKNYISKNETLSQIADFAIDQDLSECILCVK